ncbi:MAG: Flp pilus assembly complex ATPase component TadA [Deltaproteobacteria bacterium]|nr:Flp pilus assembly complex ATPase component TadA [Deltaproteobacteria bacterium]
MSLTPKTKRRAEADQRLLSFLVRAKKLDAAKAQEVERLVDSEDLSAIQAMAARGILSEEEIASAIGVGLRVPLLNLNSVPFDDQVTVLVKGDLAARAAIVPIRKDGQFLILAMSNPFDQEAIRTVEFTTDLKVRPAVAPRSQVVAAIEESYKLDRSLRSLLADIPDTSGIELVRENGDVDLRTLASEAEGAPIIKMVNLILVDALAADASDIHVEPGPNFVQVRYRINGVLEDVLQVPKWAQNPVVARLKVMAKLDITERRVPQDGHLRVRYEQNLVDFRVSSLPTHDGEKIVMRILNAATGLRRMDRIGLSERDLGTLRSAIAAPEGMILVTGPTGSGKTTTLYSIIQELLSPEINIVTIENPIEYQIKGISQVEVNEKQGLTFASALRSILRQDPDVILIGEIRDRETAEIAFQAAQTGHLVLSTLHTNDTVATITRLLELGIEHHVLASSLVAVAAQRLVRAVCARCREPEPFPAELSQALGLAKSAGVRGKGCPACRNTGFAGRTGIYEVLRMSPALQKLIEAKNSESPIRTLAQQEGMTLLRQGAVAKIESEITTPEEVLRVVQVESREPRCPQCAHVIEPSFAVCPYCLYQLQVHCPSCGAPLKKEWKSCPYCGPAKAAAAPAPSASPAAPVPAMAAVRPEAPPLGAIETPMVLIVDDNDELRKIVRLTLERGARRVACDEAANGFEALGKVEARKPHLIILDVMMPGMDGVEVCKRLRAKLSTALIPVIMLTARADPESKELGFLAGTDDYLTKPFERQELVARVHRLLERTYGWGRSTEALASA